MAKSLRRKLAKGCGWLTAVGLVAAGAVVYFWADFPIAAMRLSSAMERAEAAGVPLTQEELRPGTPVQPELNAAPIYLRIFAEHEATLREVAREMETALASQGLGPEEALSIAARLATPLEEVYQASLLPYYVHEVDLDLGMHVPRQELFHFYLVSKVFSLRAVAHARLGRARETARDLAASQRLASHVGQGKDMLSAMGARSQQVRTLSHTRRTAEALSRDPAGLALLEDKVLRFGETSVDLRRAMLGEAYFNIALMRNADVHTNLHPALALMDAWALNTESDLPLLLWPFVGGWFTSPTVYNMDVAKIRRSGKPPGWLLQGSMARALDGWAAYFEAIPTSGATDADFEEGYRRMVKALANRRLSYAVASAKAHKFEGLQDSYHAQQAAYRTTLAYIDLLQYRNEHGRWPESLAEAGVQAVDPFDGQPLRYRLEGEGFRIWSVGRNKRDDGGLTRAESSDEEAHDLAATYPQPAMPAPPPPFVWQP